MEQMEIVGKPKLKVLIPTILPVLFGVYVISRLSWTIQVQRYHKDPISVILVSILLFVAFFSLPIFVLLLLKKVIVNDTELIVKYPFNFRQVKFYYDDIKKYKISGGINRFGKTYEQLTISLHNGTKVRLRSHLITNYEELKEHIFSKKKYSSAVDL